MTLKEKEENLSIDTRWDPSKEKNPLNMDLADIARRVKLGEIPPQDLRLLPYQVDHFKKIADDILPKRSGYLDGSSTGRGKTIVTAAVSLSYNMPIFVICPNTVKKVWEDIVVAYNIDHIEIMTYDLLAGRKPSNLSESESVRETELSHGYLIRIDKNKDKEKISYAPTKKLLDIISVANEGRGVLFVFDECQSIKNYNTARFKACRTIANALVKTRNRSRFAALSASPFDKKEHAIAFFRLFGILNSTQLYTKRKNTRQVYFLGIQEIIDYTESLDQIQTKILQNTYGHELDYSCIDQEKARNFVYVLYDKIVKNHIGSSIPDPNEFGDSNNVINGKLSIYDGYFNVPKEDRENLRKNVNALQGIVNPIINGVEETTMNHLARMTMSRKAIEMDKAYLFSILASRKLNESPTNRVILVMNFIDSIDKVSEILKDYNPLILTGQTKSKDRSEIINRFQTPNDIDRLLIMNTKIGGVGISLHDLYGGRETYMYISPDFSIINIFQSVGRAYRTGLRSDVTVYIVYGVHRGCYEANIIKALSKKNKVMKGSIPGMNSGEIEELEDTDLKNKILFPGEYPMFMEENDEGKEQPNHELTIYNDINIAEYSQSSLDSNIKYPVKEIDDLTIDNQID